MYIARACRCLLTAGALTLIAGPVLADAQADAIIKKAQAAMNNVNSYQAVWEMQTSMGPQGSMSMTMTMKSKPKEGKFIIKIAPAGKPTGQMAMAGAMMNMEMVDDGKTMYMYMPVMGGYRKGPHTPNMNMKPGDMALRMAKNASFTYKGVSNVGGRPAYVLKVVPKNLPAGVTADTLLYIDRATNRIRKSTSTQSRGPQKVSTVMLVKSDAVNGPIPDSAFKFVPPPGAKEIQGGGPGMGPMIPGMVPGGGGPRPAPRR